MNELERLAALALGAALIAALAFGAGLLLSRLARGRAAAGGLDAVFQVIGQLQAELARVGESQEILRRELQRSREASLRELNEAAQGILREVDQAQRALVEVRTVERGRARQLDQAADSLRRLEAVIAGSAARGVAGENILAHALNQLPPDLLELNVPFGSKVVEYALRLPGGRYVPIDSKWTSLGPLEQLQDVTDASERRRLCERVARDVRVRIREMEKYLDPDRTLGLGLLAVPDAVHAAAPEVRGEGYREGVLVVPYSLALPFVLAVYQLALRFGAGTGDEPLAAGVRRLEQALVKLDEEVEGRLSRGLAQVAHAREALREQIGVARRTGASVLRPDEAERPVSAGATQPEVGAE